MSNFSKVFGGIIIIVIIMMMMMYGCISSYEKELRAWAAERGEIVEIIEYHTFDSGPYFYIKGNMYFYMKTDKNVYWIKYSLGRTIKRETANGYENIE